MRVIIGMLLGLFVLPGFAEKEKTPKAGTIAVVKTFGELADVLRPLSHS